MKITRIIGSLVAAVTIAATLAVSPAGATNLGNEGCTPGYWKNHSSNWEEYTSGTKMKYLFTFPASLSSFGEKTMLQSLQGGGGSGVNGAAKILLRAAAAAYLNAAHEGVGYPYRRFVDPFNIRSQVNAALASGKRDAMLNLATILDTANNLGCPLN